MDAVGSPVVVLQIRTVPSASPDTIRSSSSARWRMSRRWPSRTIPSDVRRAPRSSIMWRRGGPAQRACSRTDAATNSSSSSNAIWRKDWRRSVGVPCRSTANAALRRKAIHRRRSSIVGSSVGSPNDLRVSIVVANPAPATESSISA